VSAHPPEAALVGVRATPAVEQVFAEAADVVEVVRHLWDSWEDDAIIRDVATGRFVDRDKLHYVDFIARTFTVKGPSIVPRPPQGQPVVAVLSHVPLADELAARQADVVVVTPHGAGDTARRLADVRAAEVATGRQGEPLRVLADLVVFLGPSAAEAAARRDRLDALDGAPWQPDAPVFTGTAGELAEHLVGGLALGLDGYRLRPAVLPHDLVAIAGELVPALQRRGAFRTAYEPGTLRARLGLDRPANLYVESAW
jgi:alkanesulfonate monooxygenase SsuD/methylene tetrahydromethanopterin reductase-like flavin-dependent oxidoreductase (luciferase family)